MCSEGKHAHTKERKREREIVREKTREQGSNIEGYLYTSLYYIVVVRGRVDLLHSHLPIPLLQ